MSNNPLSPMSYTNKDFNAIFTEMLETVKTLTYKWDPSISNESDPGVILLKLNAILADKNNYNIDKNILEAFPESASQEVSVRSNYNQLGYKMPWYQSAKTKVSFKWLRELSETDIITIDKYKSISDADNDVIYTLLEDLIFNKSNTTYTAEVIEGQLNTLKINGVENIELSNLDDNNRIYFDDYNVAENGIFIRNTSNDTTLWEMVENLTVQPLGKKCFEFGIDSRSGSCFIEFPEDIYSLIGTGLSIKYIISNGEDGNISARFLSKFYEDYSILINEEEVILNSETIELYNPNAATDGANPQTIEDAFKNYKRFAGTFNTLVTLRDYINSIYNSELISNGYVCDRTNDIQSNYLIMTEQIGASDSENYLVEEPIPDSYIKISKPSNFTTGLYYVINGKLEELDSETFTNLSDDAVIFELITQPELDAFDLRLYLLHNPGTLIGYEDITRYESSFDLIPSESSDGITFEMENVENYISTQQCIQHNFKNIIANIPCMFKNSYPLNIKIIPQYKLTEVQKQSVKRNILSTLIRTINSRQMDFGIEPSYDIVYAAIENSDERIKSVILDDFKYTTFACYWDADEKVFKEIPVSELTSSQIVTFNITTLILTTISKFNKKDFEELLGYSIEEITDDIISAALLKMQDDITDSKISEMLISIFKTKLGTDRFNRTYFIDENTGKIYKVIDNNTIQLYSDKLKDFRLQIFAKSILAGKTPLFNQDDKFEYNLNQKEIELEDVERLSTNLIVCPHGFDFNRNEVINDNEKISLNDIKLPIITKHDLDSKRIATYTLQDNESIQLYAPSFLTKTNYSNYVKYQLVLKDENSPTLKTYISFTEFSDMCTSFLGRGQFSIPNKYSSLFVHAKRENSYEYIEYIIDETTTYLDKAYTSINQNQFDSSNYFEYYMKDLGGNYIPYTSATFITGNCYKVDANYSSYANNNYRDIPLYWQNGNKSNASFLLDITTWADNRLNVYYDNKINMISSDTDYQLREGESIIFFYKTEDSNTAPYSYSKYGQGTIIKPSFNVIGVTADEQMINPAAYAESGSVPYAEVEDSDYQIISSMYGNNDLSGNKTIDIRDINEKQLKPSLGYNIYFITNNIQYDSDNVKKYILSLDSEKKYVLGPDEYFIFSNNTNTEYQILGAGTLIQFNGTNYTELSVTAVNYTDVAVNGINTFISYIIPMNTILNGTEDNKYILIREQQLYNLTSGDRIDIKLNDDFKGLCPRISDKSNAQKFGKFVDETFTELTTQAQINEAFSKNLLVLQNTDEDEYPNTEDYLVLGLAPCFSTDAISQVIGYSVSYVSNDSSGDLPVIDMDTSGDIASYVWNAKAVLNINSSYNSAQKILNIDREIIDKDGQKKEQSNISIQQIGLRLDTETLKWYPENIVDAIGADENYYMLSSITLNKVGGNDIDISYLDAMGERLNTSIFIYKDAFNSTDTPYFEYEGSSILLNLEKVPGNDIGIDISNTNTKTMLVVTNTSPTLAVSIKLGTTIETANYIEGFNVDSSQNLSAGTYYLKIDSMNISDESKLFFIWSGTPTDKDIIKIEPLFRYSLFEGNERNPNSPDFTSTYKITEQEILSKVQELDINNIFKYNFEVDDNDKILNPLQADTFFNSNHIFNQFTIGEGDLRMYPNTESNILIINNR